MYRIRILVIGFAMMGVFACSANAVTNIYSRNAFGYQRIATPPYNYEMMSVPFDTAPADINQIIGAQVTAGSGIEDSDNILFFDTASQQYKLLYLLGNVGDTNYNFKWIDTSLDPDDVATMVIPAGVGFWFRNRQPVDQNVTVVGEVVNSSNQTVSVMPGYQMIAYPFSSPIELNQTRLTNGAVAGSGLEDSDNIIMWNPASKTYIYYYLVANADPAYNLKWIDTSMDPDDVATTRFSRGQAFWYVHRGSGFNWVEARPYSMP